jgi:predicted RNase H-like HicB family nuclease
LKIDPLRSTAMEETARKLGRLIVVRAVWDSEAGVWVAESEDVPGLVTEADSVEALEAKLTGLIQDLLEDENGSDVELPVHIIAESFSRVHVRTRAA